MARPKKPLVFQKGHLNSETKIKKERAEVLVNSVDSASLLKPPSWLLDKTAIKEYKRVVKEMFKLGILNNLDVNNLGCYCNSYSLYLKATEELKTQPLTIVKELPNGCSNIVENPLIKIQKTYSTEMRAYANLVGLTLDGKLKMGSQKVVEEKDELKKIFGL